MPDKYEVPVNPNQPKDIPDGARGDDNEIEEGWHPGEGLPPIETPEPDGEIHPAENPQPVETGNTADVEDSGNVHHSGVPSWTMS